MHCRKILAFLVLFVTLSVVCAFARASAAASLPRWQSNWHCLHYLWELRANCELMRAHIRAAVLEDSSQTAVPRVPKNEDN